MRCFTSIEVPLASSIYIVHKQLCTCANSHLHGSDSLYKLASDELRTSCFGHVNSSVDRSSSSSSCSLLLSQVHKQTISLWKALEQVYRPIIIDSPLAIDRLIYRHLLHTQTRIGKAPSCALNNMNMSKYPLLAPLLSGKLQELETRL